MGLLDNIVGAISGGGKDNNMMDAIGGLLGGGGIGSLVENFTKGGLGDMIGSWIGTGSNLPISAEQIQSVLGSDQVKAIAGKLGISPEEASNKLASVLPDVVDKLTPDGKIPDVGQNAGGLGDLLKGLKL
ncbi:MAG: YidB family protein [Bacteroidota bacterium]|jgi:uncharacterized protein YidB (DUF937 family)|nr:YidB family protein [Bacteroidota bacterium]